MVWLALSIIAIFFVGEIVSRVWLRASLAIVIAVILPRRMCINDRWMGNLWFLAAVLLSVCGILITDSLFGDEHLNSLPLLAGLLLAMWQVPRARQLAQILSCAPLEEVIESSRWQGGWSEKAYKDELVTVLSRELGVRPQPERPLASGTRIDICLRHDGTEHFISLKKLSGNANQQRLVLQGELEDIMRELKLRGIKRYRVTMIVGVPAEHAKHSHHLTQLQGHVCRRMATADSPCANAIVIEMPMSQAPQSDVEQHPAIINQHDGMNTLAMLTT